MTIMSKVKLLIQKIVITNSREKHEIPTAWGLNLFSKITVILFSKVVIMHHSGCDVFEIISEMISPFFIYGVCSEFDGQAAVSFW